MNGLDKLRSLFKEYNWSWWGQRTHDALGLNHLIDFEFLVSCDWGSDIDDIWGDKVISLELSSGKRTNYSNEEINYALTGKLRSQILKKLASGTNCIMYRSIKELEKLTRKNKSIKIYSAPVKLKNMFDNKILFRDKLEELSIPVIPGLTGFLKESDYTQMINRFGKNLIIKYPVSSSGQKIHSVEHERDYSGLQSIYPNSPVIIERFLDGYSVNINGIVREDENIITAISLQVIGNNSIVSKRFGFGGNDFSSAILIDKKIKREIYSVTEKIMQWMSSWGYRGIMGIDLLIWDNKVYPVEINPRFQNSTSLLTLLEIEHGIIPAVCFHLAEFNNDLDTGAEYASGIYDSFYGSQLILHNLQDCEVTVTKYVQPGVYRFDKGQLSFIRKGYSLLECENDEEFVICGGVPVQGAVLKADAPLIKLHFKNRVLNDDLYTLNPEIELLIKKIYNEFIGDNNNDA